MMRSAEDCSMLHILTDRWATAPGRTSFCWRAMSRTSALSARRGENDQADEAESRGDATRMRRAADTGDPVVRLAGGLLSVLTIADDGITSGLHGRCLFVTFA